MDNKTVVHLEPYKGDDYYSIGDISFVINGFVGSTKEEVLEALQNTAMLYPPKVYDSLFALIFDASKDFLTEITDMDCITNSKLIEGAITIFYPGVAEKIRESLGEDFYIVFTSRHEFIVHPISLYSVTDLKEVLLATINEATEKEDFLTYNIYKYSEGRITQC